MRDGREKLVHTKDLVSGDILFVEASTIVPADAVVLDSWNLVLDESIFGSGRDFMHKTAAKDASSESLCLIFL